jgi:CubicO group peptidase (beta-lactamase class C family)
MDVQGDGAATAAETPAATAPAPGTGAPEADWAAVQPIVDRILTGYKVPGLVLAVAWHDAAPSYLAAGCDADGRALAADTLFPVASITKLATALAVLRLAADGSLAIDDPLARYLPDAAAARAGVTLRTLLCHTAGLPLDLPDGAAPYRLGLDWRALAHACTATRPATPPWTRVQYSNLGPGLLAIVVERLTGRPFAVALAGLVLAPLGIEGTLGSEPPRAPARIDGRFGEHTGTALEPFNSPFWRSLALPWAGLVTNAAGALALVRAFAGQPTGFLPPALLADATRNQTRGLPGGMGLALEGMDWPHCPWGLGAELRGDKTPHATPPEASPASFGHSGASGCLVWADPAAGVAWAILGTRVASGWPRTWPALGTALMASHRSPASPS